MSHDPHALNPRQREAVLHGDGPLLILAGAGTGKTRTLAYRIAYLVERGVAPGTILAVAFTNKSADELKERVKKLIRKGAKAPSVSTFHSFCVRVLRNEIEHLGYKRNFTIYDTADQLSALKEALREVRMIGRGDVDAKRVLAAISRAKNEGREPDPGDGTDPYAILAAEAAPRYASALKAYNAVDFDDLLVFTLKLFREFPEVLERWRERCRHVLVDEFQDTNAVQYRLVSLLAGPGGNLTVVGDDDQSIYGWRGALPGNILDFTRDWPTAKVITLDQNYRSTGHILAAANTVIRKNSSRREKNLWSDLGEGVPVTVLACKDSEDEANAVVERIIGLVASDKARAADCAVIFRTNAQSRSFEDVLRRHRMRYVVIGGMRFYDRKEVRDLIAYLQAIHNPLDEIALLRVVNYPARGVGNETIHRLQEASLGREATARRSHGGRGERPRGRRAPGARARGVPGPSRADARAFPRRPHRRADRGAGADHRPRGRRPPFGEGPGRRRAQGRERPRGGRGARELRAGRTRGRPRRLPRRREPFRSRRGVRGFFRRQRDPAHDARRQGAGVPARLSRPGSRRGCCRTGARSSRSAASRRSGAWPTSA